MPYVEPPSLASVLLNLIVSNFLFKPFKITPGHKKPANQQLMEVEQSLVSYSRHINRLQETVQHKNDDGISVKLIYGGYLKSVRFSWEWTCT